MNTDDWTRDGLRITDPEMMRRVAEVLEHDSPLIVEHRFYRGSRAPHRFVCETVVELEQYLRDHARAGDSFWMWSFEQVCRDDNPVVAAAKMPDREGRTPAGGAY